MQGAHACACTRQANGGENAGGLQIARPGCLPACCHSPQKETMTSAIYTASIPVFKQMLGGLSGVLAKAEAHVAAKNIDPNALLQARLFPDMFPMLRQVQVATDFAKSVAARLAGVQVPSFDDKELSFAELQARVAAVLAFIDSLDAGLFDEAATREIVTQAGTPKEKRFTGQSYLFTYGLPHFFFHITTAYAILRHNGVEVGKKDYVASY
jgi:hypothetical protein